LVHYKHFWTLATLCLTVTSLGAKPPSPIVLRDTNGVVQQPLASGRKATVLFFIARDCPISNGYAPEINRIQRQFARNNIAFYAVHADTTLSVAAARQHARDYSYQFPVVLDSSHRLVKASGARVTPEAVIFAGDGRLLYRGRIDNKYVAYGKARRQPTQRDVRDVLTAVVKNQVPRKPITTTAVGCFIS
jgi:peroxiredoxin